MWLGVLKSLAASVTWWRLWLQNTFLLRIGSRTVCSKAWLVSFKYCRLNKELCTSGRLHAVITWWILDEALLLRIVALFTGSLFTTLLSTCMCNIFYRVLARYLDTSVSFIWRLLGWLPKSQRREKTACVHILVHGSERTTGWKVQIRESKNVYSAV